MAIIDVDSVFKVGAIFPPNTELKRLQQNRRYQAVFDGNIGIAFPDLPPRLTETVKNYKGELLDFFNPINVKFGKLIPKKYADFIFGRTPNVVHTKNSNLDKEIKKAIVKANLWNNIKKSFMDCYKFGNGISKCYNKSPIYIYEGNRTSGDAALSPIESSQWIPVLSEFDYNNVIGNIVGTVYSTDDSESKYQILIEYYKNDGSYKKEVWDCSRPEAYGRVTLQKHRKTWEGKGLLNDNPIKIFTGFSTTEDGIYGQSAYTFFYEILKEIIVRYTQIAKVIDKHAMPVMTGPTSALSTDQKTGERYFKRGDYIAISPTDGSIPVKYLEWDGKVDASFKELDYLVGLLYQMSETGAPFLDGDTDKLGFAESARALKIRHKSPIAYANAWVSQNENIIKESIKDVCKIQGFDIDEEDLEITYNLNLPEDELEKSQIFQNKVNAGFSRVEEMKRDYRMNQDGAETEFESYLEEQRKISEVGGKQTQPAQAGNGTPESVRKSNDQISSPNKSVLPQ